MRVPITNLLAIATSIDAPDINPDDETLVERLRVAGVTVDCAAWSDREVEWSRYDAVLIRSTWDYHTRYAEFLDWLHRLEKQGVRTINPTSLLHWNSHKRYLLELAARGIDIVPTQLLRAGELRPALDSNPAREVVIKPAISASAWRTVRGRSDSEELIAAVLAMPPEESYLLQPFVPEIVSEGEWSLLFFGGAYSHSVLKRPAVRDYRVQREFGGTNEFTEPAAHAIEAAQRALAAAAFLVHERPTYARIDGVVSDGRFLIMEMELIEPFLFLSGAPEASARFADAIVAALGRVAAA